MQHVEVSGVVRHIYMTFSGKGLRKCIGKRTCRQPLTFGHSAFVWPALLCNILVNSHSIVQWIWTVIHSWQTNISRCRTVLLYNWVSDCILCLLNARKATPPSGRKVLGMGLWWLLACWEWRFKSCQGHGCLSLVSVVCHQVQASVTDWSLVWRSPSECGVSKAGLNKASLHATCQQVRSSASEQSSE
jgi:hypothetical protein